MNTKNYHHIPQNLLFFTMLVGLFALPLLSFTIFRPAATNVSTNVLGESSQVVNGMTVTLQGGVYEVSGIIPAKKAVSLSLDNVVENKKVYLLQNAQGIIVTLNENTIDVANTTNTDKNVSIVLK